MNKVCEVPIKKIKMVVINQLNHNVHTKKILQLIYFIFLNCMYKITKVDIYIVKKLIFT